VHLVDQSNFTSLRRSWVRGNVRSEKVRLGSGRRMDFCAWMS
jgi:hypothetical protein